MKKRLFIYVITSILAVAQLSAQGSRVMGTIKADTGERIQGVSIALQKTKTVIGISDEDGKFSIIVEPDATLVLTSIGYAETKVKVRGRQVLDIQKESTSNTMEEVEVIAQLKGTIIFEPSEIEVVGNYFHLRTRFKVPSDLMTPRRRLIVQPTIYNVTKKKVFFLKPVVSDGVEYTRTQSRMYDFDIDRDTLSSYIQKSEMTRQGEIILYHDSAYIENSRDDYRADVFTAIETYRDVVNVDTASIARGTVNPLRFFDYSLGAQEITDSTYFPKPEPQLRNDKGEMSLSFLPGRSEIDETDSASVDALQQLQARVEMLSNNPDAKFQSLSVKGVASPDGKYDANVRLAKARLETSSNRILSFLSPVARQYIDIDLVSEVESWQPVVEMLKADTLYTEADELQAIIDRYPRSMDSQFQAIVALKYYRPIIVERYLSKLRKVEYNFGYSIYRILRDDEIKELYHIDKSQFSRYEFFRMFNMAETQAEKDTLYKESLEIYPRFMLAANNLAVSNITHNIYDESLLKPFVNENAPAELMSNQIITLLNLNRYTTADSVASLMQSNEQTEYIKSVARALNGNYHEALDIFGKEIGVNKVVLLLALKQNESAWDNVSQYIAELTMAEDTDPLKLARAYYVGAIAANRLEKIMEAITYIELALELDPDLRETAEIDADIKDLL